MCIGTLAALSAPVAANAAAWPSSCDVHADRPVVTATGKIHASATRLGCRDSALVRIQIKRAVAGADPVVKSGAYKGRNGRAIMTLRCAPGVYYTVVRDNRGNTDVSRAARLSCDASTPTATPSPTGTATPTKAPTTGPTSAPTASATPTAAPTAAPTATAKPTTPATPLPTLTPAPTATATVKPTPKPTPTASSPGGAVGTADENEVLRLTNAERAKGGCQPLKHDAQLRAAAYGHSADMAAKNYFSHTSQDGRSFMDRIRAAGFTGGSGWAENIAMGQPTPASVVTAWMNSSGHRANIMNCKYTLIGVGAAKNSKGQIYWTQDFAAR
ncbi:CAP domain-containing protein [Streptosporangium sp. NPDC048047]|uniref:CAP domain-containing protein n=1 Tax=unclassified Streptosporangium TaxID=2632669 RepID=UPI0034359DF0